MFRSDLLTQADWQAIGVTVKLASVSTLALLVLATPVATWLALSSSRLRPWVSSFLSLPLVLPPTVLGFYLLLALGPEGVFGLGLKTLDITPLVFTFPGLVLGSVIYSFPFVVQPIQAAIEAIGSRPVEVAATLRASPWDRFFSVILPLARPGFLRASILGFAHTVGEFGVVLMIGGNREGETRVASVQLFEYVESMQFEQAHRLAAVLLLFSFLCLLALSFLSPQFRRRA
jgi:molybdate transport system permease protein